MRLLELHTELVITRVMYQKSDNGHLWEHPRKHNFNKLIFATQRTATSLINSLGWLSQTLDYTKRETLQIDMKDYIDKMTQEFTGNTSK